MDLGLAGYENASSLFQLPRTYYLVRMWASRRIFLVTVVLYYLFGTTTAVCKQRQLQI